MYIITVDLNGNVGKEKIDRLKRIHETPQDPVIVVYTNRALPDGYTVSKSDELIEHFINAKPEYDSNEDVKKAIHEQRERRSKVKFFNE